MEDPFDELTVPDDWIQIINSQSVRKRSFDESGDEASPSKVPKLNKSEDTNGTDESLSNKASGFDSEKECNGMVSQSDSKDGKSKDMLVADGDVFNGDLPSVGLLKNDSAINSQETLSDTQEIEWVPEVNTTDTPPPLTSAATEVDEISPQNETSDPKKEIKKIPSVLHDAKHLTSVFPEVNEQKIYNLLLEERNEKKRLDVVSTKLLESGQLISQENGSKSTNSESQGERSIFTDVDIVIKEIPSADANQVFTLLESFPTDSDRVRKVIDLIKKETRNLQVGKSSIEQKSTLLKKESTFIDDPTLRNDPVFCDMRFIAKMFPNIDRNEIYALLEANMANPNRIDAVVNEILATNRHEAKPSTTGETKGAADDSELGPSENENVSTPDDVERLRCLFPDIDPNYLYERFEMLKTRPDRCDILAAELFEKKNYPKVKAEESPPKELAKRDFTVEEFLKKFPDPQKTFGDEEKAVSEFYRQHTFMVLKNDFRMLKTGYIRSVMIRHKNHLLPAYQTISADVVAIPIQARKTHRRFLKTLRAPCPLPPIEPNEFFYHELWYTRNEQKVKDFITQKEIDRTIKLAEAKERGELYECCCCYDDECFFEDLASCPEGHLFCKVCVVRSTEAAFGEMKSKFPCLTGECDQSLPLSTLQSIVPANLFSKILSRIQEEEVQQANIPDLVTCPFCPFATIMPNQDDKVLKCLNPDCLKESCRLCQEESHIPLKCSEIESRAGRGMRTFIENYIAEAVMRKCHKCGKKFIKDSGCNRMTCVCGANSCYACKAEDIDYGHFTQNMKCANVDPEMIHQGDMEQAAVEARVKYLEQHPEDGDVQLDADFNKWFQSLSSKAAKNPVPIVEEDDSYEDEDSYGDDSDEEELDEGAYY